ncbi:PTPA-CTERM sorting domain-containing protein [Butyrivibrio hungatei]
MLLPFITGMFISALRQVLISLEKTTFR